MPTPYVRWEVGYKGDMARILRYGPVLGQDHISDKHETKVVRDGLPLTPFPAPTSSGERARERSGPETGSPSCCVADV